MLKTKKIIYSLVLLITIACNMSDSSEKLSGGYNLVHEGEDYNMIFGKKIIYPDVIDYNFNDNYIIVCQKPNKFMYKSLLGEILWGDYFCYNNYIKDSLSQKNYKSRNEMLADSTIFKIFKNKNVSFENTIQDKEKGEEIVDSIIKNNPIHKKIFSLEKIYWIIKIKGDVLFGPFTKEEYLFKRKNLNIEEDLELKS